MTKAVIDPEGLEAYFTDVEHLRGAFNALVAAPSLARRLLVIHGVGGVGKSSLLRMFRLHCKGARVAVGLASGDEAKSAVDVLSGWAGDLKADGVKLPALSKTIEHHRTIQAKVEEQARKSQDARGKLAEIAGKAASKTAEAAAGAATGAAIGSIVPGIGTAAGGALGGILGGMGAEALVDWLRGFLNRPDIDLLLDPAQKLTEDFLADIADVAAKRRLVLMLDTFEQLTALEDWARDLAQRLTPNVLLVIGGRAAPDWSRQWPGWLAQADVQELKPMSAEVMRELVGRYYATIRGDEPDPAQVEAITSFARGLPIVVTSAVRLWVQYGVEDFQAVKPQVVADLVDRLLEGVPAALVPALEAAATVRWFNKDVLRAVTGQADVNTVYDELRRFPFVRPRVEGLALHDAVREIMDENMRMHDPQRHRELHERAAAYFETWLAKATGQEAERLGLERLYHRIGADEEEGVRLFQEMAEDLVRYQLMNRLNALLNDVKTYPLEHENSRLWREYYGARLVHFGAQTTDIESIYQTIADNEQADFKLRAYALCDLGHLLRDIAKRSADRAIRAFERIPNFSPKLDTKLATYLLSLSGAYRRQEQWDKAALALEQAREFYEQVGDIYGIALTYKRIKDHYFNQGHWKEASMLRQKGLQIISGLQEHSYLRADILRGFAVGWYWTGILLRSELELREALSITKGLDIGQPEKILGDLGLVLGLQGKFQDAVNCFETSLRQDESTKNMVSYAHIWGNHGFIALRRSSLDIAEELLNKSVNMFSLWPDTWTITRYFYFRGILYETKIKLDSATKDYQECLKLSEPRRHYYCASALTGLVRVKHAQGDYAAIPPLLAEAEALAQQYEYNDHLASLRLTQGHIAWDDHMPELGRGFDAALGSYRHALIHALRYNRFLLDEVLWGGGVATPLRPLIPHCQERGEEGRRMLAALRDWWRTGVNDLGAPRPDTISPIPEGIALLEAERVAREHEPGDGAPQRAVVERIEAAL